VHGSSIIAAASVECNNTNSDPGLISAMMRPDRQCRGSRAKTTKRALVSQRNLIYIVGAIIVVLVVVYFLRT
jgi:hypothetical protein